MRIALYDMFELYFAEGYEVIKSNDFTIHLKHKRSEIEIQGRFKNVCEVHSVKYFKKTNSKRIYHRDPIRGPAVKNKYGTETFYYNGLVHRPMEQGPAFTSIGETTITEEWWVVGKMQKRIKKILYGKERETLMSRPIQYDLLENKKFTDNI